MAKKITMIIFICLTTLLTISCSNKTSENVKRTRSAAKAVDLSVNRERNYLLEQAISSIDGVEDVRAVITGNTAIIGIAPTNLADAARLSALKKEVETRVKLTDLEIDHVTVTASPKLLERMKHLKGEEPTPEPVQKQKT